VTGAVVWFTGLPASGKSTLAQHVQSRLLSAGRAVALLDSDELREVLEAGSYAAEDRARFYRSLSGLAAVLAAQGLVVLVAATATQRADRDRARAAVAAVPGARFVEVWVKTPLVVCEARDRKNLYARARRGELSELPGVGVEFEPPPDPDVRADGGFDAVAVAAIEHALTLDDEQQPQPYA